MKGFSAIAVLAFACAGAFGGVVQASETGARVDMSNIDTSSEAGADRLLRRIRDSAQSECAVQYNTRSADAVSRDGACMHTAMARSVAVVGSPLLTARFHRVGAEMILAITAAR